MTAEAFWTDPPWRGGRTPFRLGLMTVADEAWLPEEICDSEYQRKVMYLGARRTAVLAAIPDQSYPVDSVAESVRSRLLGRGYPDRATLETSPLARAALMVPDDLCILVPSGSGWRLVAACLCSPSYWRLEEKIGRPMAAIHAPVPGLERTLGMRIARFLDHLPIGQVFLRRNWNVHRDAERFHPEPEDWDLPPDPAGCAALCIRSERQTLRKFDDGALLFTIAVSVHPLAEIRAFPAAVADLLQAIAAMSPDERNAFGYQHHGDALVTYLRGLNAGS